MSKMLTQSWPSWNGMIRHNLTIVFLLIGILTADLWGRRAPDDPRLQMIETFTNRKYDFLNQTDIDTIMSFVTKSVRQGRNFHYMLKLRDAMERETKKLDAGEDVSSKDWQVQAFRPAVFDEESLSYTDCEVCKETRQTTRCNVTRVELLVPLIHPDKKIQLGNDLFVEINGYTVNSSRGIMDISGAAIFDLSDILLNPDAARPDGALNITIKKQPCHNVFPKRCMLYEYCNINSTILDRFRAYSYKRNKSHTNRVEEKQHEIISGTSKRDSRNNHISESMSQSEHNSATGVGEKESEKLVQPNQSLVSLQKTTLSMPRSTDKNNLQTHNNSQDSNYIDSVAETQQAHENGSSQNVSGNRNTRSLRKPRAIAPPDIAVENSEQPTEQEQPQKKKRQLPAQRNYACGNSFDTLREECKRRSFYVDFQRDLNRWDIIRPEDKVDIGYCSGTCHHVIDFSKVNYKLSAHAVIMNRMRRQTPRVTCSPRKMSSISILRISDGPIPIVLENMFHTKVESCWCT